MDPECAWDALELPTEIGVLSIITEFPELPELYLANGFDAFLDNDGGIPTDLGCCQGLLDIPIGTSIAEQAKMAIRGLLNGDRYLPDDPNLNEPRNKSSGAESFLSPRQLEIMQLLAQGLSNKEIANILGITEGTIRVHLSAIFKAIKVSNRTEATLWYLLRQKKLVD